MGTQAGRRFRYIPYCDYSRLTKPTSLLFAPGWHAYLDRLEAILNNRVPPDLMRRLAEIKGLYSL